MPHSAQSEIRIVPLFLSFQGANFNSLHPRGKRSFRKTGLRKVSHNFTPKEKASCSSVKDLPEVKHGALIISSFRSEQHFLPACFALLTQN